MAWVDKPADATVSMLRPAHRVPKASDEARTPSTPPAAAAMHARGAIPTGIGLLRTRPGQRAAFVAATLLGPCRALVRHGQDPP